MLGMMDIGIKKPSTRHLMIELKAIARIFHEFTKKEGETKLNPYCLIAYNK